MSISFICLTALCLLTPLNSFLLPSSRHSQIYTANNQLSANSLALYRPSIISSKHDRQVSRTKLQFDVFGLGPVEIALVAVVGALLFGPDTLKFKGGKLGKKEYKALEGWEGEQKERIDEMAKTAGELRRKRGMQRLNQALEDNDPYVLQKMEEYETIFGDNADS